MLSRKLIAASRGALVFLSCAALIVCFQYTSAFPIQVPQEKPTWRRVYTGEESIIEINASSMRLEPHRILRAQFRTILSKPESLAGSSGAKYRSRLETIDFKLNERRYRQYETTWLDPAGKKLQSHSATSAEDWRVLKEGGVMERLFTAARALPPFGRWKAVAYRLADGSPGDSSVAPELEKLLGTRVHFQSDRAAVGAKVCASPAFQGKRVTREELFRAIGIRLESIGVKAEYAETTNVRCEDSGWLPPQSLLLKVSEGEMLMLWDGVFLVLRREKQWTGDLLPPLKRAIPGHL